MTATPNISVARPMWRLLWAFAWAGFVALALLAALGVYFGVVLANRPDVPLQAPPTVTAPVKGGK